MIGNKINTIKGISFTFNHLNFSVGEICVILLIIIFFRLLSRIRTFNNAMITILNSQIDNVHILNWSKSLN